MLCATISGGDMEGAFSDSSHAFLWYCPYTYTHRHAPPHPQPTHTHSLCWQGASGDKYIEGSIEFLLPAPKLNLCLTLCCFIGSLFIVSPGGLHAVMGEKVKAKGFCKYICNRKAIVLSAVQALLLNKQPELWPGRLRKEREVTLSVHFLAPF